MEVRVGLPSIAFFFVQRKTYFGGGEGEKGECLGLAPAAITEEEEEGGGENPAKEEESESGPRRAYLGQLPKGNTNHSSRET